MIRLNKNKLNHQNENKKHEFIIFTEEVAKSMALGLYYAYLCAIFHDMFLITQHFGNLLLQ